MPILLLAKVVGTQNDRTERLVRSWPRSRPRARDLYRPASSPRQDREFASASPTARRWTTLPGCSPSSGETGRQRCNMAPDGSPRRRRCTKQDRRDEDRRRQDARRDAAGASERARRQRRPRRHVNDYLAAATPRMGRFTAPRHDRGAEPARSGSTRERRPPAADITYGTNNIRLRPFRDNIVRSHHYVRWHHFARRRFPSIHRRSADAADHFRSGRRVDRSLLRGRFDHPEAEDGPGGWRHQSRDREEPCSDRRLHQGREAQNRHADRERHGGSRSCRSPAESGGHDPANMPALHHITSTRATRCSTAT